MVKPLVLLGVLGVVMAWPRKGEDVPVARFDALHSTKLVSRADLTKQDHRAILEEMSLVQAPENSPSKAPQSRAKPFVWATHTATRSQKPRQVRARPKQLEEVSLLQHDTELSHPTRAELVKQGPKSAQAELIKQIVHPPSTLRTNNDSKGHSQVRDKASPAKASSAPRRHDTKHQASIDNKKRVADFHQSLKDKIKY
eukprot:c20953_g1_i1.p1 GENE.c20953_g1_i1~~c20953_g1_i1.p1  ORF type:complete len:207 (+),score=37.04 c20953_g1_i1:30-623(+)